MNKFYRIILFLFLMILSISLMFGHVHVISILGIDYSRYVFDNPFIKGFYLALLLILLNLIYNFLEKNITSNKAFFCFLIISNIVFLFLHLIWIRIFPLTGYVDMNDILENVFKILNQDYSSFVKGGYLYIHSNNIPIVLIIEWISRFFKLNEWHKVVLVMQYINVLILQIIFNLIIFNVKYISNRVNSIFSSVILILFLPFTAYVNYVYNDIFSVLFFLIATIFLINSVNTTRYKSVFYILLSGIFLVIGNLIRPVGYIFLIAFILFIILRTKKFIRIFSVALIFFTYMFFPINVDAILMSRGFINTPVFNLEENNQLEILNGICKGTSKGNDEMTPGYHFMYCDSIFKDNINRGNKVIRNLYFEQIKLNLSKINLIEDPFIKFIYHWGDGNFETDLINTINRETSGYTEFRSNYSRFRPLLTESWLAYSIYYFGHVYWLGILFVILISVLGKKFKDDLVYIISILGFIGFYGIWEISPHYNFVILYAFVILFSCYFKETINTLKLFISTHVIKIWRK